MLSFALPLILQHPAVLSRFAFTVELHVSDPPSPHALYLFRLVDEVAVVLGDREVVTSEDVEKLEYTLQVRNPESRLLIKYGYSQSLNLGYTACMMSVYRVLSMLL